MRLYNTMSRQVEEFVPFKSGSVGLYACGVTVYDYVHLGHLRKYVMDDVLIRVLRRSGFQVQHVQNITDVGQLVSDADTGEDKLEKGAKKYGQTVWEVAKKFEDYFWYSMDLMGNTRPDISCRATEHITEQLEMVKGLEKKGFTYVIDGDGVYFDTSKLKDYGKLARLKPDELEAGARVEMVAGKRHPTDFALWKFERPGENRAMVWESPWSKRSFPGWHIECSAMAMKYLGEQFDVHTGGIDHIPVHHTNEIAQAEALTGRVPFVKYWVHHNFLRVNNEKMSKSLGNFFTIDDVLARKFCPMALRLLFLTTHYRSEMNFTWESLAGAQAAYDKLIKMMTQFKTNQTRTILSPEKLALTEQLADKFNSLINDDLKTPEAMSVLWEVTKSNLPGSDKYDLLISFDEVLGLDLRRAVDQQITRSGSETAFDPHISELINKRDKARAAKNWVAADQLRDELAKLGYQVRDESLK